MDKKTTVVKKEGLGEGVIAIGLLLFFLPGTAQKIADIITTSSAYGLLTGAVYVMALISTLAGLASNQDSWVRFVVEQENPTTTRLRARLWADGAAEPSTWQIEASDTTASLQNISGGVACDGWSSYTSASGTGAADVFFDELTVRAAP